MKPLEMKPNTFPGLLVCICGLDGCGKTTMLSYMQEHLASAGADILMTKQPTDFMRKTELFRNYMDSPDHSSYTYRTLSLWAAGDRLQHVDHTVAPALAQGRTVLCDRYFYSCLANLFARGYEDDRWIYEIAQSIIQPDLAIFLDVPVQKAMERVRRRPAERDRYIDEALQYRLRSQYLAIAKENGCPVLSTTEDEAETKRKILCLLDEAMREKVKK